MYLKLREILKIKNNQISFILSLKEYILKVKIPSVLKLLHLGFKLVYVSIIGNDIICKFCKLV